MKTRLTVTLVLVLGIVLFGATSAAAFPGGTWVSGITVRNLSSSSTANITISFYYGDDTASHDPGDVAYTLNDTIAANTAKTWYVPSHIPDLPSPFIGSAVVSSDQPVAATVNTQVPSSGTGTQSNPNRVGSSSGVSTPSPTVYATQLMKNYYGWNSYCAVQNTGSTATTVTVHYYNLSGAEIDSDTANVAAYASYIFDQSTDSELPDGFGGSAKFEGGGQNLAVVCNFYNQASDHTTAQFHSYNGVGSGAQKLWIPRVVKDYYNYQSGLKIQNVGSSPTTVTVTYKFGSTTCTQTSPSIGPGQSWGPYLGDENQLPSCLSGVSGSGSAVVEAATGGTIIGTVNEDNRVNPPGRGVTYNAFLDGEGKHNIIFPQVTAKYYGYSSGWQVQLVEAGPAICTATYSAYGSVSEFGESFTLANEGDKFDQFAPNASGMGQDYNGSVLVSCDKNIVGIANLSFRADVDPRYGQNYGDSFTTYNGILTD